MVVLIDGAHIRTAQGYPSRHVDATVGKIEGMGKPPRRLALAPKGAEAPLAILRQALREQGWQPGRPVMVLSDGEAALPNLVRAAMGEPVTCILDCRHIYALDPQQRAGLELVEEQVGRLRHRAEGCVDEIAKKPRMRWSPQGAHRIAVVRAAVLDGRLKMQTNFPMTS